MAGWHAVKFTNNDEPELSIGLMAIASASKCLASIRSLRVP